MRSTRALLSLCSFFLVVAAVSTNAQDIVINEFMASNNGAVLTDDGQAADWIELHNPSRDPLSLAGMYLSDRIEDPIRWQFPDDQPALTTLPANGYVVVWASGFTGTENELHADFSLDADGETVILTAADGQTIIDLIEFERQSADISFGRSPDGSADWRYLYEPTPGQANSSGYVGAVEPVEFSVERGFYDEPITLTLSCETEDAWIWYTLDGSVPNGPFNDPLNQAPPSGMPYSEPLDITGTTCVRAVAVKQDWKTPAVITHTYIYLDDVMQQPNRPDGFPNNWGGNVVDYAMDQDVVDDPVYAPTFKEDLKTIPSVCIALPNDDFFGGARGIYANAQRRGDNWERFASMEWIDPTTDEHFNVNTGLRVHGGVGRSSGVAKHSLRFAFRNEYGPPRLEYPLFPDSDVTTFDSLVLRGCWNYSWIGDSQACGGIGTEHTQYMRDAFARDTIRDMGGLNPYGRHVHVYINGLYWGIYILVERPDDGFASAHLGGSKEDYDVLKASNSFNFAAMEVVSGDLDTWESLFDQINILDLSQNQAYQAIAQQVDIPALIDYMLMVFYVGSRDAPTLLCNDQVPRNFYTLRRRNPPGPFIFLPWDVEWSLENVTEDRVSRIGGQQNPGLLMRELGQNPNFRLLVADRVHRHFFNDGAMTVAGGTNRYWNRSEDLARAVVGESARWGDARRSFRPYTRDDEWMQERDRLMNEYLAVRTDIVLDQLRNQGWYPLIDAPEFLVNDQPQHGGTVSLGDSLTLAADTGTIYYTLDGSEPRTPEESGEGDAVTLFIEKAAKRIWVPTQDIGADWRGGNEPYDDSDWNHGLYVREVIYGGVGYERDSGYEPFIGYNVETEMYGQNASCYIRVPFTVTPADLERFNNLTLNVRCDDGFVAYLNGTEVASINRPENLAWNSTCENRPDSTDLVTFTLDSDLDKLHTGVNILAVQAINQSPTSSDFLFSAELIGSERIRAAVSPTAIEYTEPIILNQDTHIKARVLDIEWSALSEAVFTLEP